MSEKCVFNSMDEFIRHRSAKMSEISQPVPGGVRRVFVSDGPPGALVGVNADASGLTFHGAAREAINARPHDSLTRPLVDGMLNWIKKYDPQEPDIMDITRQMLR